MTEEEALFQIAEMQAKIQSLSFRVREMEQRAYRLGDMINAVKNCIRKHRCSPNLEQIVSSTMQSSSFLPELH